MNNGKIVIEHLVQQIAQSLADGSREQWEEKDDDDPMRETIVTAMNAKGWEFDAIPGVLPHILHFMERHNIPAFSTFNGLPPVEISAIATHPEKWFISGSDAHKVRAFLLPEMQSAPTAKVEAVPVTTPADWCVQARAIADECFNHDTSMNCRDSLRNYSARVMDKMQERGIKGPRGIIDNPATIMREALQAKKWWANKNK